MAEIEIIHADSLGEGIENASEEVDYLARTALYFMGLVNLRYDLKLDPYYSLTGHELQIPPAASE
jgi:hypothetical protein